MKVFPFRIPKPDSDAIIYQEDREYVFYNKYHEHEEIQISCIIEGEGTLIVGETVNNYKKGDVIIIGSHIPHVFKSEEPLGITSVMLSLFFTKNSFGDDFFDLEELKSLRPFFNRAESGFMANSNLKKLFDQFLQLNEASKFERFLLLMNLLKMLSNSKYKPLSSFVLNKQYSDVEGKRMSAVIAYTIENFSKHISLDEVSQIAAMTKTAFCKYFKKRTNKTYFQFLNELRVASASKLIIQYKDMSIAEIAENSGFNNMSNFNRQFKAVKHLNPTAFKKISQ